MIVSSVGVMVYLNGISQEILLTNCAVPWYEVKNDVDVIPDEVTHIEIVIRNIMTKEIIRERIPLSNLPERPNRMTRLNISISCVDKSKVKLVISDMGFGDIYPATGGLGEYLLAMI
jgi:hypothetical protein